MSRSQAAGHPRPGEPSVSELRRSGGLRDWLFEPASQRRARRGEPVADPFEIPARSEPQWAPVDEGGLGPLPDFVTALDPADLVRPADRGFVESPFFATEFEDKLFQFGLMPADGFVVYDDDGPVWELSNVTDQYGAELLWEGWYDYHSTPFDDVLEIRREFLNTYGIQYDEIVSWEQWREAYSQTAAAA